MAIIAVDFDGTLYQENSITITIKEGRRVFTIRQWFLIIRDIIKGLINGESGQDRRVLFLESFFQQMEGKEREEIYEFFVSLVRKGHQGVNHDLLSRLNRHLDQGDHLVILSGALQPFLEIFIKELKIPAHVIGTPLYFNEKDICTGRIGKINHGIEKVNRLKDWISNNNLDGQEIWAYADSESDIPILEFANRAIVVQPSDKLRKLAILKGWELFQSSDQ